jgi:hypothetical protein
METQNTQDMKHLLALFGITRVQYFHARPDQGYWHVRMAWYNPLSWIAGIAILLFFLLLSAVVGKMLIKHPKSCDSSQS